MGKMAHISWKKESDSDEFKVENDKTHRNESINGIYKNSSNGFIMRIKDSNQSNGNQGYLIKV